MNASKLHFSLRIAALELALAYAAQSQRHLGTIQSYLIINICCNLEHEWMILDIDALIGGVVAP